MKMLPGNGKVSGLTLVEVLVVIVVIVILAAILLPALQPVHISQRGFTCLNNQQRIAYSILVFQGDHNGKFPWEASVTNGGSQELVAGGQAAALFQALNPYTKATAILVCPMDKTRTPTNVMALANNNISYFLNLDASTNGNSILTGDRYLEIAGKLINSGVFLQTTNLQLHWSDGFHHNHSKPWGGFSFADGHAAFITEIALNSYLQGQPRATNRFCIP